MSREQAQEFLRSHHRAVLATLRADGRPQQSPVLAAVDADGRAVVSTRSVSAKVTNLRRTPQAWLCVTTDAFFGPWLQVGGPVDIVEGEAAVEGLVDYYRRLSGEHPDWDGYRDAMRREGRVLLRMRVEDVVLANA